MIWSEGKEGGSEQEVKGLSWRESRGNWRECGVRLE